MNNMPLVSSAAMLACAAACVVTVMSTAAFGACKTTLRGELVADDLPEERFRVRPTKLLFFSLHDLREKNGVTVEETFQLFRFPNTKTTFPIPFALNIDSPRDCPTELTLWVQGSDRDGLHYEFPLNGRKKISLEKPEFESVRVSTPSF